ncbi:hypothetical protein P9D57_01190 [Bacillus sonorensis]|uniref:hypothetical protein n=1 Tax=Bacillus sonorensis TaxID=119858 RepID=UPI002DBD3551|nr:hypothetical protein [Bacillus sonorensis]MEC1437385.1 hypothetical protein [Bacillus sonorensis]
MEEKNLGGLRLNLKVAGVDNALEKLDRLNELLREANSLVKELAVSQVQVKFTDLQPGQEQVDS